MRLAVYFLATLAALGLALVALAVPAPAPRAPYRQPMPSARDLAGVWTMRWGGTDAVIRLDASGHYSSVWGDTPLVGTWRVEPERHRFVIEETRQDSFSEGEPCYSTWTFELRHDARGRLQRDFLEGSSWSAGSLKIAWSMRRVK